MPTTTASVHHHMKTRNYPVVGPDYPSDIEREMFNEHLRAICFKWSVGILLVVAATSAVFGKTTGVVSGICLALGLVLYYRRKKYPNKVIKRLDYRK